MYLKELKEQIDAMILADERANDLIVCIAHANQMTKIPYTKIKSIKTGVDWDNNKCIITPEKGMSELSTDVYR